MCLSEMECTDPAQVRCDYVANCNRISKCANHFAVFPFASRRRETTKRKVSANILIKPRWAPRDMLNALASHECTLTNDKRDIQRDMRSMQSCGNAMEILTRLLLTMNSANDMQNFGAEHVWQTHSHAAHRHTPSVLWLRIQLRERDVLKPRAICRLKCTRIKSN